MALQESGEMYLETILILSKQYYTVRAIDIVRYMGFSKASVSRALARLREDGLISTDDYGHISCTEKGMEVAERIYRKRLLLKEFFIRIGVDEETAAADACRIEHVISDKTFDAINRLDGQGNVIGAEAVESL